MIESRTIMLILKSEVYQAGLISILKPDYKVIEFNLNQYQLVCQEHVKNRLPDVAIVGIEADNHIFDSTIGDLLQEKDIKVAAIPFQSDAWIIEKTINMKPHAVLHHTASPLVIKKAIRQILRGEHFADERMAKSLLSFSLRRGSCFNNNLTNQENKVLNFILEGLSNKQIANNLSLSERTIKFHCQNIYRKIGASNRNELIKLFETHR